MALPKTIQNIRVEVTGVVQGVGFRPFIYRIATENGLNGWVRNTSGSVDIEIEGEATAIEIFLRQLETEAPPICSIESVKTEEQPSNGYHCFEIKNSQAQQGRYQLVSPDIATCPQCLKELLDPDDRRYHYPFTNCTNCGPRFTIIKSIPYDRPRTTMDDFKMCPECQLEYDDPANRRFHAQPNACPVCGPYIELVRADGEVIAERDEALKTAADLLCKGNILAIKGLGGFLLVCDATSDTAVSLLRQRKKRPEKPLAVMFRDIEEARKHCSISKDEEKLLLSPQSPIVLVKWEEESGLSKLVAPGLKHQGVMLPYTPLHHILMQDSGIPLVMTSGNISEEPIAKDNEEALERLGKIADYFLMHNRGIYARYDDSVVMVTDKPQVVRRARGYAPSPVHLPYKSKNILACGSELKNTFCLARDEYAFVSQHIADMENLESLQHYKSTVELYRKLFSIEPEIIAHDMHPDYLSTSYALELAQAKPDLKTCAVQHHHAHIVSCMVENGIQEPVIGVAFDGTGYGTDGCIWGGEIMVVDYKEFKRLGHIDYMPLPGGDAAIKRPYRIAASYIYKLLGKEALLKLPFAKNISENELEAIFRQVDGGINTPLTSSCGRLFDAVSALIGIRGEIGYEAQAAIELEMAAMDASPEKTSGYKFSIIDKDEQHIIKLDEMMAGIIRDIEKGVSQAQIAHRFHRTMAQIIDEACRHITGRTGLTKVALSGGVFQNRLLLRLADGALKKSGFEVITHSQVPTNDGCISLGQAVVANFMTEGK